MDVVSVKLDDQMLKRIDGSLKENNYSTRTEFIRDAIRAKLDELLRRSLIQELMRYQGVAAPTSDKERRRQRDQALKELIKESGWE
jgi:metal-responsive CopG/Arc/MetJ family transcriptional regulator